MAEVFAFRVGLVDPDGKPLDLHCTPQDTELYTFSDKWRDADHIFHRFQMDSPAGAYLWRSLLGVEFDEIAIKMIESQAYCHHFKPIPEGADLRYFLDYESQDVTVLPDDWQ